MPSSTVSSILSSNPSTASLSSLSPASRLLLVSNRLPVAIKRTAEDSYTFTPGSGGLVSGLSGLSKTTEFKWYGWPGLEVPDKEEKTLTERLKNEYGAVPIFLDDVLADLYYNGFSSKSTMLCGHAHSDRIFVDSILWPLFHYHPGEITWSEDAWIAYQAVNQKFAQALAKEVKGGDRVWIHDFHLMLLPAMLREELGHGFNVKIGFFLHTPFPSSEIYRILPVRKEILSGVLECDLLGFHTGDYSRHFLSSCSLVL